MTSTSVPTLVDVLSALLPAFALGILEDVLVLLREMIDDLLTFTIGDVTP